MARKRGRDLFEILGARAQGVRPTPPRRRAVPDVGLGGIADRLRGFFAAPKPAGRRRTSTGAPGWSGLAVAAVAVVVFGVGFLIGRGTSAAASEGEGPALRHGATPEWLGGAVGPTQRVALSREEEEAKLSTFGFVPVIYSAPDRPKAARVAEWLREQGLDSARLRPMEHTDTKERFYFVVVYTDDASGDRERERLVSLAAPDFAPKFAAGLRALSAKPRTFPTD